MPPKMKYDLYEIYYIYIVGVIYIVIAASEIRSSYYIDNDVVKLYYFTR